MRVLLTTPDYTLEKFYPSYQTKGGFFGNFGLIPGATHPLGLMYLSSALKERNHEVKLIDGLFNTNQKILKEISYFGADLVGIKASAPIWDEAKKLARLVKERCDVKVAVGGPHINTTGAEIIEEEPSIDFAAEGDGEVILPDLCEELEQGRRKFETQGLVWRKNEEVVRNEPLPSFAEDLDEIPFPDRRSVNLERYCPSIGFYRKRPNTTMVTTRGCKRACEFCHAQKLPLRMRSVENVIEEFREIEKLGVKDVILYDQDFGADRKRAIEICERIIEEDFDFYIGCNLRIDSFDQELVKKMRDAGFWRIFYGIESGVQKNLNRISKGTTVQKIEEVVRKTDEIGIQVFGSFIFGIPGETYEEGLKTIEFAKELPLSFAKFMAYSPWPGSEVWDNPEEYGTLDRDPDKMGMNLINFVPGSMTHEELQKLMRKAYREFYMQPSYILKRIGQMKTQEDLLQNIRGFLAFARA